MEQKKSTNCAAVTDAQNKQRREECALGMEQRLITNDAEAKDAQNKPRKEECA